MFLVTSYFFFYLFSVICGHSWAGGSWKRQDTCRCKFWIWQLRAFLFAYNVYLVNPQVINQVHCIFSFAILLLKWNFCMRDVCLVIKFEPYLPTLLPFFMNNVQAFYPFKVDWWSSKLVAIFFWCSFLSSLVVSSS